MKSKLVTRLERLSKPAQPMGFRTAVAEKTSSMLLIANLTTLDSEAIAATSRANVDAVILPAAELSKKPEAVALLKGVIPWGIYLNTSNLEEVKALQEKGCDFVIFEPSAAPASALKLEMGKIVQLDPSLPDGMLRTANLLPVDGILVRGNEKMTVQRLMAYYQLGAMMRKPLIAELPAGAAKDLAAAWEAGVNAAVVGGSRTALDAFRKEIEGLPAKRAQKREVGATLPSLAAEPAQAEDEEEDDEP